MTPIRDAHPPARARQRGFSLIELMVSILIALGLIVAMGTISMRFETSKRESTASSNSSANAAYLSYDLDRQLRSAGSGFITNSTEVFGCVLNASRSSAQILPAPAAFPAPFASVPQTIRMMPILVYPGIGANGSDVIQFMVGTGGIGEVPTQIRTGSVAANTMRVTASTGMQANDLLLVSETGRPCMLEQVSSAYTGSTTQQVDLAGTYYAAVINGEALNDRSTTTYAHTAVLGNAGNGNAPRFMLLGVNSSNQLARYDLLRFTNGGTNLDEVIPTADGVMDMRVRYGVDTSAARDGVIDAWVMPDDANYNTTVLNAATSTAQDRQLRILAVKISLVLRSDNIEKPSTEDSSTVKHYVAPATLTMFSGLDSTLQATYTVADRYRRHTVVEITIPIRNVLANNRTTTPS